MRMKIWKKISAVTIIMIMLLIPMSGGISRVYAATNPYPGNMNSNCTYAAWQKTKDILGIELPGWGNAWTWYSSAQSAGYSVGTTPRANSIVVFKQAGWNNNYGHVAFVTEYNSSTGKIYKLEGNYNGTYHEGWAPAWENDMYGYIYLDAVPTPTAHLSVERKFYNPGDTVTFNFSGDNTNGTYTLGIYKGSDRYHTVNVNANSYSIQLNEVASYSAYMTSYGISGGFADSNWVDWQVLPLTAELKADKTVCNVNDTVTLSFGGNNSNTFRNEPITLAVWCDGEYVVHKNVNENSFAINCDKPGVYTSYMTAYGGGALKDSNWVSWTVYPLTAELSVNKKQCNVNEKVTLSFSGNNSNTFANDVITLAVWCNGEYVVHKNVTDHNYVVTCDKPGEYTSYMTAYGGGDLKDSNWVSWTVYPLTGELTADKTKCYKNESVNLTFGGYNRNTFTNGYILLNVFKDGKYYIHPRVNGKGYTVKCDQPGKYSAYLIVFDSEDRFVESNQVKWTVLDGVRPCSVHTWDKGKVTKAATILNAGNKTYTCTVCGKTKTETIKKLTPTIKLSATKKSIKTKKSFALTISKLAKGDSVTSVKSGKTSVAAVKKAGTNKYTITGKKKGTAVITVKLKSGKKATCTVTVK